MTSIALNLQRAETTPPSLQDLVSVYPVAGLSPGASDSDATNTLAENNQPQLTTLAALRSAMTPPDASTLQRGVVELATVTQARDGTDAARAVTPAGVAAAIRAAQLGDVGVSFTGLTDTPSALGAAGEFVRVASSGLRLEYTADPYTTAAELVTALSGLAANARLPASAIRDLPAGNFRGLTDTPASFGTAGQVVAVNSDATGLTFTDAATGGGGLSAVVSDATLTGTGTLADQLRVANPFTAADEAKLDGIAAGAQVNVPADWNSNTGASRILNKPNIPPALDGADIVTLLSGLAGAARLPATAISGLTAGVTTFRALTDTPGAYGNAGQIVRVNSAANALEFANAPNTITAAERSKLAGIAEGAEVNVQADWNASTGDAAILNKPTIPTLRTAAETVALLSGLTGSARLPASAVRDLPAGTFAGLTDTPAALGETLQLVRMNAAGTALEFSGDYYSTPSQIVTALRGLEGNQRLPYSALRDTPAAPTATSVRNLLETLTGNDRLPANAIRGLPAAGASSFAALSDTPAALGTVGQLVAVNAGRTGLTFTNAPRGITQAQVDKLAGIEANATADQTGAEMVTALTALTGNARLSYNALRDLPTSFGQVTSDATLSGAGTSASPLSITNPFTTADEAKLDGIAAGAEVNVRSDWNATTGDAVILNKPAVITAAERSKLAGVEAGATGDQTGAEMVAALTALTGSSRLPATAVRGATFAGLTDTPAAYTGQGGKYLAVNSGASALEFVDAPTGGGTAETGASIRDKLQALGGAARLASAYITNVTAMVYLDPAQNRINVEGYNGVGSRYNNLLQVPFTSLSDTPEALGTAGQIPAVNAGGTALEFVDAPTGGGGGGLGENLLSSPVSNSATVRAGNTTLAVTLPTRLTVDDFYLVTFLPDANGGAVANGIIKMSATRTELKFTQGSFTRESVMDFRNPTTGNTQVYLTLQEVLSPGQFSIQSVREIGVGGASTFAALTDTPEALGTRGQIPAVNAAGTALEFVDAPSGGGGGVGANLNPRFQRITISSATALGSGFSDTNGIGIRLKDDAFYLVVLGGRTGTPNAIEVLQTVGGSGSFRFPVLSGTNLAFVTMSFSNPVVLLSNTELRTMGPTALSRAYRFLGIYEIGSGSGGGSVRTTFTSLTDTPATLGTAGQIPVVNSTRTALEWASGGGGIVPTRLSLGTRVWGSEITTVRLPQSPTASPLVRGRFYLMITGAAYRHYIIFRVPDYNTNRYRVSTVTDSGVFGYITLSINGSVVNWHIENANDAPVAIYEINLTA